MNNDAPAWAADALDRMRTAHPLVHSITNYVVMNVTATALVAAFLAAQPDAPLRAASAALAFLGLAGERAAARSAGPGSFQVALLDELAAIDRAAMEKGARIRGDA